VSRSLSRWQAVVLGLVVLVGGLLVVGGVFAVGSRGWFGKNVLHVKASFQEVRGVEVGTRVRIRGIDAGEVVQIIPPEDSQGPVLLRLRIKGEYRKQVRSNSTVQIVSEGMIGGKVLEIRPPQGKPGPEAGEDEVLRSEPTTELSDVLTQVGDTLKGISSGEEGVGRELVSAIRSINDAARSGKEAMESGKAALDRSQRTMASFEQSSDALKRLPIVRGYVKDPTALLVRPNASRNRKVYKEADLFEPGRAQLTGRGRDILNEVGGWMDGLKHPGSEVVVVSYAAPGGKGDPRTTQEVTRQQAQAVVDYLKKHHSVHKLGWVRSRKVTALGMGEQPPPAPEPSPLPPARVEMLVFVPS
jgi:hypothetical protein